MRGLNVTQVTFASILTAKPPFIRIIFATQNMHISCEKEFILQTWTVLTHRSNCAYIMTKKSTRLFLFLTLIVTYMYTTTRGPLKGITLLRHSFPSPKGPWQVINSSRILVTICSSIWWGRGQQNWLIFLRYARVQLLYIHGFSLLLRKRR